MNKIRGRKIGILGLRAPETAVLRVIEETAPRETSTDRIERVLNGLIEGQRIPDDQAAH